MIYLYTVEEEAAHINMAQDRSACAEYLNLPIDAATIMAWMEDELTIQREQASFNEQEYEERMRYVAVLERDLAVLAAIGIEADPARAFMQALEKEEAK
jgi:hypothetical protein